MHFRHSSAYMVKSTKIEWFLARRDRFDGEEVVELFVHPDYRDGVLIDKTKSSFGNEMKPLEEQIDLVKQTGAIEFVSWASINR